MALQSHSSSSSSFSSSMSYGCNYDVFLSFRGVDTRYGLTGNLYKALSDRGIHTFIDDRELQGGDEITPSLVKAIEDSRIFIPVFSINYASSSFCLDELVHIIHCFKAKSRLILPVFYGVDPSNLRHQTGTYGKALAKHEESFQNDNKNTKRLQKWKMALNQVAHLSGYHFDFGNEYEYVLIRKIVDYVSKKINHVPLHVADYPVGLQSRVLKVNSLLDVGSDDKVKMLGIYGIGGMGKTTLAKAIYNFIADQFEYQCFLHNVRENKAKLGLKHLQEELLFKTVGLRIKLGDVSEGIPIIKQRLRKKKVLLILDDIDELKQLQALAGGLDWFGLGSRVIITTRDKHLLTSHGTYEVDGLNKEEALELLRWNAFKKNKVDSSYDYILNRAVTYASGLPLALEVVGSNLFGKHIEEWKSTFDRYERIPNKEIQKILKVTFDALEEDENSVFLDIACCFKGYALREVIDILHAHYGDCMKLQIGVLVEKSLIKISQLDIVTLHDLIEDMGKEIVRQESPKEPGRRSRLWFHEDIVHVLENNLGTSETQIIHLDLSSFKKRVVGCKGDEAENIYPKKVVVECKGDELKKMENLKTLIINNILFSKGPKHLPNSLRVLQWSECPIQDIPSDFYPKKLSICKLQKSGLTSFELCGSLKKFENMRELKLNNCQCLTQILDISGLQNLEILSFHSCINLLAVHDSVGFLNKLKILDAQGCIKLTSFPPLELTSLQELRLSHCSSLKSFPEILGEMQNIKEISLANTSIKEFPFSFQNLIELHTLRIYGMRRLPSSILTMPKLSKVYASGCCILPKQNDKLSFMIMSSNVQQLSLKMCNLSDKFLSIPVMWFANLESLSLLWCDFMILSECLKECRSLRSIELDGCTRLQEIKGIPPNLKRFSASHCKSMTSSCRSMLLDKEVHKAGGTLFCLPTTGSGGVPEWFEHQSNGQSISFWFRNKVPSVALFFASKWMHNKSSYRTSTFIRADVIINGYEISSFHHPDSSIDSHLGTNSDHTILLDLHRLLHVTDFKSKVDEDLSKNEWNCAEISFVADDGSKIVDGDKDEYKVMPSLLIESGIHVFKQKTSMEDIQFTDPCNRKEHSALVSDKGNLVLSMD